MANPGKSIYAFGINRERPGWFDLAFLSKPTTEGGVIQTWVRVLLPPSLARSSLLLTPPPSPSLRSP